MIEARLRTQIPQAELDEKIGKIVTNRDVDLVLTGPAKILKPNGQPLCVYLPGALGDTEPYYPALHALKGAKTSNRGTASGSKRMKIAPEQKRSYSIPIASAIIGAIDGKGSQYKFCRLTAWSGREPGMWQSLWPMLRDIAAEFERHVPDRYAVQAEHAARTHPDWIVPGTPFTTCTVNNSYPTGVHQDAGDLEAGFSTIAVIRRGNYRGGILTFPRYRIGVDMHDGDLILLDAHEWHGNTAITCDHQEQPLNGPCPEGCERVSVVTYMREAMTTCGSPEEEFLKAEEYAKQRSRIDQGATA